MMVDLFAFVLFTSFVGNRHWFVPSDLCTRRRHSSLRAKAENLSIAVVGSGAVGGYYGARLWECSKYDVKFHMRGQHYQVSTTNGLNVTSNCGDIYIPPESMKAYQSTEEMGAVDWVVVALKSSSLDAIPDLLTPLLKPETRVLTIMNGLVEDDLLSMMKDHFGRQPNECCAALYGGMALICSNRVGPGRINHSYAGLLSAGVATSRSDDSEIDRAAFEDLFNQAKVDIAYETSLLRGRWKKNVWNLPFNGISVALGGITVDKIVTDPGLRRLAFAVMDETIAVANADLEMHGEDPSIFLGEAEKETMMNLSDGMGPYKTSTMIDLLEKRPMEVAYLFRKPLERARQLGIAVPHLETLVVQIEAIQRFHNLF